MFKRTLASRYQLIKIIGKGAFGKTYLAKDIVLPGNPLCVVKKLNPTAKEDGLLEISRRLFKTEAESLQKLGEHPQIPQFLGFFEEGNHFYLVQEYIQGHSLSEEITSERIWSEAEIIELLKDCLNILDFIHSQNVIHRDIKPDNLIRRQADNKLVLVDFGAVKEAVSQSKIASTIAIGTQGYMPSEQARGKPRFNSDIYALGIIAIQALTGLSAVHFRENDEGDIIWFGRENINPKLAKIINKMTRYHFKDRYPSASKVLKDLNNLDINERENLADRLNFWFNNNVKKSQKNAIYPELERENNLAETGVKFNNYPQPKLAETLINKTIENTRLNYLKIKSSLNKGVGLGAVLAITVLGGAGFEHHQKQQRIVNMLDLIGANYQEEEYDLCLQNANLKAREIGVPQERIDFYVGKCALGASEKEAENKNYAKAIALAREIPANNPFGARARANIDKWSQILLDRATSIYEKEGDLEKASQIIANIPRESPLKETALKSSKKWQEEVTKSEQILADADKAMAAKKWQTAIDEANKVKTVNSSIYWQEKADKIAVKAKDNHEKELAAARQRQYRQRQPVYTRKAPVKRYNTYRRPTYQTPTVRQKTVTYPPARTNRTSGYRVRRRIIRRETVIRTRTCRGSGCR